MPRLLLIGWDAADWKVINPLMDQGLMPSLQSLVSKGVKGRIATLDPPLSPTLWTSIATGKRPYKHGIHGFTEPTPDGKDIRPIYNLNRKCKAIWNILSQENKKCHVVGWWPSHPAEPINGTMISNFYQRVEPDPSKPWNLMNGTVHPPSKADFYAKLRVHPAEMTAAHLLPFIPDLAKVDFDRDTGPQSVAKFLADCSSIHCAGTHIVAQEEWDFAAVYFDAIDHFCHAFMRFHPPHRPHVSLRDYDLYKDAVAGAYRFHDMMLGRYLELIDEDTYVMLISDHGFHPGEKRLTAIPDEPTGPAFEHSPYGIYVLKGPGVKQDELVFGTSILDITPTILHIFGLPIGNDMDGKVVISSFIDGGKVKTINSWEEVEGADGRHPADVQVSDDAMKAEIDTLVALGYISDPGPDKEKAVRETLNENNYNLARAYINGQRWEEGIALLEALHKDRPDVLRYATVLVNAYQITGKFLKARNLVTHIRTVLDRESAQLDMLEGALCLAENRPLRALELFRKVEAEAGDQPQLQLRLANAYFQIHRFKEALDLLKRITDIDPEEAGAWYLAGVCEYRTGNHTEAIDHLLRSIGLHYFNPAAHYYLAEALIAIGRYEESAKTLEASLVLAPFMNVARKRLATIYIEYLNQPEKGAAILKEMEGQVKGEIVVVSGLPRSGTSMMMQVLGAGGLPLFTDGQREADENNERGFFEHEAVKNLKKNKTWLPDAVGKGAKVVAQLLPELPLNYSYKVIFMERDLTSVVASQQKMLARLNAGVKEDNFNMGLHARYEATLKEALNWVESNANVTAISVNFDEAIANPEEASRRVAEFLGGGLDTAKMAQAIAPSLRREKQAVRH